MTPPLLATADTVTLPSPEMRSDALITPAQHQDAAQTETETRHTQSSGILDDVVIVHFPEGHPDAPDAETDATPKASFRSTPLRVIAARAHFREEKEAARCDAEIERLKTKLLKEQKPNRENPVQVHELMTGSAAERVAAQIPLRPTREAIAKIQKDKMAARRRGAAALAYALARAKRDRAN